MHLQPAKPSALPEGQIHIKPAEPPLCLKGKCTIPQGIALDIALDIAHILQGIPLDIPLTALIQGLLLYAWALLKKHSPD